ncbi:MAG: tRNA (guanosine(46)-N7)-methyltransferase TrmB [Holosporales bacterium]|nr:tRNA (guanosine(46)-N7)-methyltransferase TrmB [Holosporales bacterium]
MQRKLWSVLLPSVSIDSFSDLESNTQTYRDIFVEVGFGHGEHIAQLAAQSADTLFVGCEPFVNGVSSLLTKIDALDIKNIKIFRGDARLLISEIPDGALSGAFILFPDPWPKRKHIRRRFIQKDTIAMIHRKLKESGVLRMATDHPAYQIWIKELLAQYTKLFKVNFSDSANRPSEQSWPITRYERKAAGDILYVELVKIGE